MHSCRGSFYISCRFRKGKGRCVLPSFRHESVRASAAHGCPGERRLVDEGHSNLAFARGICLNPAVAREQPGALPAVPVPGFARASG